MSKLDGNKIKDMSLEDIFNLTTNDVEKLMGGPLPLGVYSATVTRWLIPDASEDRDYFQPEFEGVTLQELFNPEENEGFEVPEDYKLRATYNVGFGIQVLMTNWANVVDYYGNFGSMLAQMQNVQVTFEIDHRYDKEDKTKKYNEIRNVNISA